MGTYHHTFRCNSSRGQRLGILAPSRFSTSPTPFAAHSLAQPARVVRLQCAKDEVSHSWRRSDECLSPSPSPPALRASRRSLNQLAGEGTHCAGKACACSALTNQPTRQSSIQSTGKSQRQEPDTLHLSIQSAFKLTLTSVPEHVFAVLALATVLPAGNRG